MSGLSASDPIDIDGDSDWADAVAAASASASDPAAGACAGPPGPTDAAAAAAFGVCGEASTLVQKHCEHVKEMKSDLRKKRNRHFTDAALGVPLLIPPPYPEMTVAMFIRFINGSVELNGALLPPLWSLVADYGYFGNLQFHIDFKLAVYGAVKTLHERHHKLGRSIWHIDPNCEPEAGPDVYEPPRQCAICGLWSVSRHALAPLTWLSIVENSRGVCAAVCLSPVMWWHRDSHVRESTSVFARLPGICSDSTPNAVWSKCHRTADALATEVQHEWNAALKVVKAASSPSSDNDSRPLKRARCS